MRIYNFVLRGTLESFLSLGVLLWSLFEFLSFLPILFTTYFLVLQWMF